MVLALLPSLAILAFSQSGDSAPVQALMREGAQAMHSGDAAAAEAAFRKATITAPGVAPARLDLGLAELKQGKLADAIADIRKSLALDPASSGAHLFLGIAEYQANRPQEAIADLQQAIQKNGKSEQAYTWLGIVELNIGHPEKAVGPLDRAAELAPADENVLDYRVQAHLAVAKQSYGEIYKLDPTSWRLHQLNAVIDSQANDHRHAVEEYQAAIKLAPQQATLYEALGWEYRALNENALAVKAFTEQLKLTPGNPIAMYNLGSSEAENGQPQPALPLLEEVVRMYRVPTQADYYLGRVLAAENRDKEAIVEFSRATQLSGEIPMRSWYELSHLYRRMGESAKAESAVLEYQTLKEQSNPSNPGSAQDSLRLSQTNAAGQERNQQ